jgi:putative heme-binding domain-containing protein
LRIAAIEALGSLKATNFVRRIAGELDSAEQPPRLAAITALGKIGGLEAAAHLRPLLDAKGAETRVATIKALGLLRDTNSVPKLLAAWNVPETRQPALEALARFSDLRAVEAYLKGLESANPALRELCRKALAPIRDDAFDHVAKRLPQLNSAALSELRSIYKNHPGARQLFDAAKLPRSLDDYQSHALQQSGDAARGQRLFFDENGLACSKCHAADGKGKAVGPDLASIGKQFGRGALIEHILYPSRAVREGYAQTIIETTDGEIVSGLVQSETADTVLLLDAGGEPRTLSKKTIARRALSSFSLMPEGLHAGLSLEQFADLIAYLESLKGAAPTP